MAGREIKTTLKVDGLSSYKSAMSEAARHMSTLKSEANLASAELTATGDQEKYVADMTKNLNDQLKTQETAIQTAKDALAALKDAGFADNSKEVENWSKKLADAQTKATEIQTELGNLESGLTDTGEAADTAGGQIEQIGKGFSIDQALSALQGIEAGIESVISKAAEAAKALIDLSVDSGKWADDLLTESSVTGIDQETIQQMRYASKFIDTDVSTIEDSIYRLNRSMAEAGDGSESYTEAFGTLGVEIKNSDGQLRSATDVFWDLIDAMHEGSGSAEEVNAAMKVMGRNERELNPLIEAGSEAYRELMGQAPVVAEESVKALGQMDDAYQDLNAQLEVTKLELMAALAPAFQAGAEALSGFVQQIREFTATEEGQKALENLQQALLGLVETITDPSNVQTVFDIMTSAIQTVSDALQWVIDNKETVVGAVEAIAAAFGLIKVSEGVLTFMKLGGAAKNLFGGGGAAAGAGGSALGGIGSGAANILKAVTPFAAKLLPGAAFAAGTWKLAEWADRNATERNYGEYNRNYANTEAISEAASASGKADLDAIRQEIDAIIQAQDENVVQSIKDVVENHKSELSEALPDFDLDTDFINGIDLIDMATALSTALGKKIMSGASENLDVSGELSGTVTEATDAAGAAGETGGQAAGQMVALGMQAGIEENADSVISAAEALANQVVEIINSALDINSPSKVMEKSGEFVAQGLAHGIEAATWRVERASAGMASAIGMQARRRSGWGGLTANELASGLGGGQIDRAVREGLGAGLVGVLGRMDTLISGQGGDIKMVVDGRTLVGSIKREMNEQLGEMANWRGGSRA